MTDLLSTVKELRECPNPWCEHTLLPQAVRYTGGTPQTYPWQVVCGDCNLKGPKCKTEAEAIAAWNTRTTTLSDAEPTDEQIKHMVNRFLMWRLPDDFHPDAGISFKPTFNDHLPEPMKHNPTGTNLFDAEQAERMVRFMVEGLPSARTLSDEDAALVANLRAAAANIRDAIAERREPRVRHDHANIIEQSADAIERLSKRTHHDG